MTADIIPFPKRDVYFGDLEDRWYDQPATILILPMVRIEREERLNDRAERLLSAIPEAQVIAAFEQLERCLARRACDPDPTRSP